MRTLFASFLLALGAAGSVAADCQFIEGNYYCNQVNKVVYNGVGFSGSYQKVTNFDTSSCSCSQEAYSFSGSLSPLDEELSVHFRGPLNLKQFAYYSVGSSNSKRDAQPEAQPKAEPDAVPVKAKRHHAHHAHHAHKRDNVAVVYVTEVAYVTEVVYATGSAAASASSAGAPVPSSTVVRASTIITPAAAVPAASSSSAAAAAPVRSSSSIVAAPAVSSSSVAAPAPSSTSKYSAQTTFSVAAPSSTVAVAAAAASGSYVRSGYYSAASSSLDGLVFLNNLGGSAGSGVWDSCFGNSLSFAASDGVSGAGSSQVLSDVTIPSNKEYSIWTSNACVGDDCGYYRPGSVAYHGFGGATKVFAFEFSMPAATDSTTFNYDMPAIWMLNAQIPRTLQYGNSACSCWSTGCGEMDLFEVLNSGNGRLTSHLHSGQGVSGSKKRDASPESNPHMNKRATSVVGGGGGTADYIQRPTSGTMKAAAVLKNGSVTIVVLPDDTTFDATLDEATIEGWLASQSDSAASVVV